MENVRAAGLLPLTSRRAKHALSMDQCDGDFHSYLFSVCLVLETLRDPPEDPEL